MPNVNVTFGYKVLESKTNQTKSINTKRVEKTNKGFKNEANNTANWKASLVS